MKSQPISHSAGGAKSDLHKVNKSKARSDVTQEEMQALLAKLKDLVPNMPKNRKLSKLEIIQYVIDYIVDLQNALETHPAARANGAVSPSPNSVSPNRQPLGVLSPPGNNVSANPCTNLELSHLEKMPAHLADLVNSLAPRQVSC